MLGATAVADVAEGQDGIVPHVVPDNCLQSPSLKGTMNRLACQKAACTMG